MTADRVKFGGRPREQVKPAPERSVVIHRASGISHRTLDDLAAAGYAIQARCGEVRVPLRPPFPPDAVRCPICAAIADGEIGR